MKHSFPTEYYIGNADKDRSFLLNGKALVYKKEYDENGKCNWYLLSMLRIFGMGHWIALSNDGLLADAMRFNIISGIIRKLDEEEVFLIFL